MWYNLVGEGGCVKMMIPDFENYLKTLNQEKVSEIREKRNPSIEFDLSSTDGISNTVMSLTSSIFLMSLSLLEDYHKWIQQQIQQADDRQCEK